MARVSRGGFGHTSGLRQGRRFLVGAAGAVGAAAGAFLACYGAGGCGGVS